MPTNELIEFLKRETDFLAKEYDRIRSRVREDSGTAGDEGEENWAAILREWLPKSYTVVTKGRILGINGEASPQVDILILSPAYPPALENTKMYLAGGVVAAFECKTTLRADHLGKIFETCAKIRTLSPGEFGTPAQELRPRILYGVLAHSHEWSSQKTSSGKKLSELLESMDRNLVKRPIDMPDLICVANLGHWAALRAIMPRPNRIGRFSLNEANEFEVMTTYIAHLHSPENHCEQSPAFSTIGALLASLLGKLAWRDASMRDLEEYFRKVNVSGSGMGHSRQWPIGVLSAELVKVLGPGKLTSGRMFNEWSAGPF